MRQFLQCWVLEILHKRIGKGSAVLLEWNITVVLDSDTKPPSNK